MKIKTTTVISALLLIVCGSTLLYSQPESIQDTVLLRLYSQNKIDSLKTLSELRIRAYLQKRESDIRIAKKLKMPIRKTLKNGRVVTFIGFENGLPLYRSTRNIDAAKTVSTERVWSSPYLLDGFNIILGIWDGGTVRGSHIEFNPGQVCYLDTNIIFSDHSTHVAGTMVAQGSPLHPNAQGMAKAASIHSYDSVADIFEMTGASFEMQISNHSYGRNSGFEFREDMNAWYWHGDIYIDEDEDYNFGRYSDHAREIDDLIYSLRPWHLPIFAVGNDRDEELPEGQSHLYWDKFDSLYVLSNDEREPDGGSDGYECIPGDYETAKNVLTVGAVHDLPNGYSGSSSVTMTSFSSWGPTDDGRIKPDIVANGQGLYSPVAFFQDTIPSDTSYQSISGTSMAAPSVSGSVALILQYYKQKISDLRMRASTIKALLIHTADDAGNEGPDYKFGWGLMNTKKALDVIDQDVADTTRSHIREETFDLRDANMDFNIVRTSDDSLKVTLCWTDPPGHPVTPALNNPEKMLVNDLDLVLITDDASQTEFYPYTLDRQSPSSLAVPGDNDVDNVEQVLIKNPTGNNYTLRIYRDGSPSVTFQAISIVVTGGKISTDSPPPPSSGYYSVSIDQKNIGGSSVDSIRVWHTLGYWLPKEPVPAYYEKSKSGNRSITTKATNGVVLSEKFCKWITNNSNYLWTRFTVNKNVSLLSQLSPVADAQLKLFGLSVDSEVPGEVAFKDPWYIDYTDPAYYYTDQGSPDFVKANDYRNLGVNALFDTLQTPVDVGNTSPYNGVLTNQDYLIPNSPYYSVRAWDQTIAGVDYFFEHWGGSNVLYEDDKAATTAAVFLGSEPVVTAYLKGHGVSSTNSATAGNYARKVVWVESGGGEYYLQTYIDNKHVYFTYSSDGGDTWAREVRVSESGSNSQPSLAVDYGSENDPIIYIVWDSEDVFGEHTLKWRKKNWLNGDWGIVKMHPFWLPQSYPTSPSAIYSSPNIYVTASEDVYTNTYPREYLYSKYSLLTIDDDSGMLIWSTSEAIDSLGAKNVAITRHCSWNNNFDKLYIAWEKNNSIYYRTFNTNNSTFGSTETIATPGSGIYFHNTPTITFSLDNRINIAWSGSAGSAKYLLRRSKAYTGSSWGTTDYIYSSYSDLTQPSIGAFLDPLHNGYLNVAVKLGLNNIRTLQWNNRNWMFHSTWLSGQHPSMTDKVDSDLLLVGTDHTSGLPYNIFSQRYTAGQLSKQLSSKSTEIAKHTRREEFDLARFPGNFQGSVSVEVGELSVNDEQWYFMKDSSAIARGVFMQSEPLDVTSDMQNLLLRYAATVDGFQKPSNGVPNVPLIQLHLVDAVSEQVLRRAATVHLKDLTNGNWQREDTLSIDISGLQGKSIALQMRTVRHFIGNSEATNYINLYRFDDATMTRTLVKNDVETLPIEFALHQNYPNPFNPTTTLKFDLPHPATVQLRIFDINGRLVKTIADGSYDAGSYRVVWDGTNNNQPVTSGIYFYRLSAINSGAPFIKTRKMILMK